MLTRLRHDAIVRSHHQQHAIDAGRASQHVVDQLFVARHVDETDDGAVRTRPIGEAEIERDTARFLFRQPVGVDPGERSHQRRLAVIDVAGGSDNHAELSADNGIAARPSACVR
ncbi:MAG TPA: hypothetical protein VFE34_01760 [Dongiaceae bacterium]|nr:hypothetical protein [Dongiaceae bacterium]